MGGPPEFCGRVLCRPEAPRSASPERLDYCAMSSTKSPIRRGALVAAALATSVMILAGCGDTDAAPATTGATDESTSTLATTVTTSTPTTTTTATTTTTTAAPATTTPTTTAPASTTSVLDPTAGGYVASESPVGPALGEKSDPIVEPLPDGTYWSWEYASDGDTVTFTLVQIFFGEACVEQFGDQDACPSDNNTLMSPSATIEMPADQGSASVIMINEQSGFTPYRVSTREFTRLVAGTAPAPDAPPGYEFVPFGTIVTVRDGIAVAADQMFTS